MLKFHIKKGLPLRVKVNGTAHQIAVETAMAVKLIYDSIHKNNQDAANEYKLKLIGMLLDPDSPVWKED